MSNKTFNAVSDAINRAERKRESSALCLPLILSLLARVSISLPVVRLVVQRKCQKFTFSGVGNVIVGGADNKDHRGDEPHTNVI